MECNMMRLHLSVIIAFCATLFSAGCSAAGNDMCKPLLNFQFPGLIDGKTRSLCDYSGKVILVVNTASECGYTPQYEGLEALYKRYQKDGLVVLGFPSNDFGAQEPGSNREVAEFCRLNYGVSFPMFEKTTVAGSGVNAFYAALAQRSGSTPRWNFHKYLIDRSGNRVLGFGSSVEPQDPNFIREVEGLLKAR